MDLTTRKPLVTLVGVVSAEWWSQKQDHSWRRRDWEAGLEKGLKVRLGRRGMTWEMARCLVPKGVSLEYVEMLWRRNRENDRKWRSWKEKF